MRYRLIQCIFGLVTLFNKQNRVTGKPLCSWQNEMAPDGIEVSAESVCVR
jgi:hypothetical protein